jgi:UDP-glucose 4-epimerase
VREIVKFVLDSMGRSDVTPIDTDRRAGDPAFLSANIDLAATELGFKSNYSIDQSIRSLF